MFGGPAVGAVTVGIDIGTTSVKAVAVDDAGTVVARSRVPHRLLVPAPDRVEHDAGRAWRRGPRRALQALGAVDPRAVAVAAMVPSLTAVDRAGRPLTPGLIYGDARGRAEGPRDTGGIGELVGFLRWTAEQAPRAHGYWPAPAVAARALGGEPVVDEVVGLTSAPLWGVDGWDGELCHVCGADPARMPRVEQIGSPAGRLGPDGPVLGAGSVDVWCEQLVSGSGADGDVHVLCGTTLVIWAVTAQPRETPGLWTVPSSAPGRWMVGGASNAGGMFVDWAGRLLGRPRRGDTVDPGDVPVWTPYPRGERTPYHDPDRRAGLAGLDLTHGPAAVQRAAWEASGFVVRHHLDLAGIDARRIVATGGGTRVAGWMQALADTTGLPVHVAAVPEGAAQGAAFLARMAAGLEDDTAAAAAWARTGRVVDPDPVWAAAALPRYERFRALSDQEVDR